MANRYRALWIDRLEAAGQDYVSFVKQTAQDKLDPAPGRGEWSAHQVAAHVRDTEVQVFLKRTRLLCSQEYPDVENFDQEAWNRDHYDADEPLNKITAEFRTARRQTVRLLRAASKQDWENWALHPEYGRISLDWLLEHNYAHTLDHLAQIVRMREAVTLRALNDAR
jgi:hypothetical protein